MAEKVMVSIAAARANADLSQQELADELGVNVGTVISWEKGRSEPNVSQLRKISELSNIPMDNIFIPEQSE